MIARATPPPPTRPETVAEMIRIARAAHVSGDVGLRDRTLAALEPYGITLAAAMADAPPSGKRSSLTGTRPNLSVYVGGRADG